MDSHETTNFTLINLVLQYQQNNNINNCEQTLYDDFVQIRETHDYYKKSRDLFNQRIESLNLKCTNLEVRHNILNKIEYDYDAEIMEDFFEFRFYYRNIELNNTIKIIS
jgi:hypothetical protein